LAKSKRADNRNRDTETRLPRVRAAVAHEKQSANDRKWMTAHTLCHLLTHYRRRSNPAPLKPRHAMKSAQLKLLSNLCFILGFASIFGSIAIWFLTGGQAADTQAHAERFGIFVGLWAPTFFILSNRFDRYAEKAG
jgi:hypothetical protein